MLNLHIVEGRLTADPEYNVTPDGTPICRFCLASRDDYKKSDGTAETDFIDCEAWSKTADIAKQYLRKGMRATVVGRQKPRSYEDKNGIRHKVTRLVANKVYAGEGKRDDAEKQVGEDKADKLTPPPPPPAWGIPEDEDFPF